MANINYFTQNHFLNFIDLLYLYLKHEILFFISFIDISISGMQERTFEIKT